MKIYTGMAAWIVLATATSALGQTQEPPFRWQPSQVLAYRVEQNTSVTEEVDGKKTETKSKLTNSKVWKTVSVDENGVATLEMSLTALRLETTTPGGEVLVFDSADPDKSNPELKQQLGKYVGPTLAVLRVNRLGKVVEVKECKFGPASRFASEPPFGIVFPEGVLKRGWERSYQVTLEPPQGTWEKFDANQKYLFQGAEGKKARFTLTTELKNQPEAPADQIPLLQMRPEGEIVVDFDAGLMLTTKLKIDQEIKGHQGEPSSYHFQSSYSETYVGNH